MDSGSDPRRPSKIKQFDFNKDNSDGLGTRDALSFIGLIFSMVGLLMRIKYVCWLAVFCAMIYFVNGSYREDAKQSFSLVMLAVSALVMTYMQNPHPMMWS